MAGMTWSIIARDRDTGQFGIAVASRFFAVGALAPYVKSRTCAIATQALVNPFYGTEGLRFLEQGVSARDVVSALTVELKMLGRDLDNYCRLSKCTYMSYICG